MHSFIAFVHHFAFSCYAYPRNRVILLELSLKDSGITYEPGDVIGIRCPNPTSDAEYVLERLQVCTCCNDTFVNAVISSFLYDVTALTSLGSCREDARFSVESSRSNG